MSYGAAAHKYNEPITVMTYDEYEDIRESMNARRRARVSKDRERRAKYYNRQRLMGLVIMLAGVLCLIVGCLMTARVLEYFGAAIGVFGLYIMVTKQMILVDKYYLEHQDRFNEY